MRTGLTLKDVRYLIGIRSKEKLTRIEMRKERPSIEIILACCLIYSSSVAEMIPDALDKIERDIIARARKLYKKLKNQKQKPNHAQRVESLKRIADLDANQSNLRRNVQQQEGEN